MLTNNAFDQDIINYNEAVLIRIQFEIKRQYADISDLP